MPTDSERNDNVGYRKPPQHSRFKKGQSGNPKGRPRESKSWDTLIDKELNARVVVHKDGRRKKISKREAIATQVVNKAVSGDFRFALELLDRQQRTNGQVGGLPIGPNGKPVISIEIYRQVMDILLQGSDEDQVGEEQSQSTMRGRD
jgi:uncharacterized protein DUF5681